MKGKVLSNKTNYSRMGKASAKLFSYIIDRNDKIKRLLKQKQHKNHLDKEVLEKRDDDSFDDSKEYNYEDIFDKNYKDHFADILAQQKYKYFKYIKSCAFNKKFISDNKKDENIHLQRYNKIQLEKDKESKKLLYFDNNPNKNYIYKKILYSQSFEKMIGRYDKDQKKKYIQENLESLRKKSNKKKLKKQKQKTELNKEENTPVKKRVPKKPTFNHIEAVNMDKMLQRGNLPEHNDVRIRTAKGMENKHKNPKFQRKISYFSLADKKRFSFSNNYNLKFSSLNLIQKNNLLINENKRFFDDKIKLTPKRMFSGFNSSRDIKKSKEISFTSNIFFDKSPKKELLFTPEFKNMKRNYSSSDFNKTKRNILPKKTIFSYTFNSKSKTKIQNNYHEKSRNKHFRLDSGQILRNNSAISFRKMLSREYLNRMKVNNNKIGSGLPLSPNYSYIYPKIMMNVNYGTKKNSSQKSFREIPGINIPEKKNEEISQKIYFSKMFGRGNINHEFPMFMNNINSRNAFDFVTAKSLKMNHSSKRRFNNPISSFNNKKSFNINISNNNLTIIHDTIKNIKNMKEKEKRIKIYDNNIKNIFKKIIYDDIIDRNDITENIFDLKKNQKIYKTINLSFKNLLSDYYKLNLDHLDKNCIKKKIDGITFQKIKSKNKIFNKSDNNPYTINGNKIIN